MKTQRIPLMMMRWVALAAALVLLSYSVAIGGGTPEKEAIDEQLGEAAERGDLATVRFLLEKGVDVDASELKGTPLMRAAKAGRLETVKFLLNSGA
ncbi:MAG: ankyrin repeat domain-containing protein, partial [Pseudomonadota bacterium]